MDPVRVSRQLLGTWYFLAPWHEIRRYMPRLFPARLSPVGSGNFPSVCSVQFPNRFRLGFPLRFGTFSEKYFRGGDRQDLKLNFNTHSLFKAPLYARGACRVVSGKPRSRKEHFLADKAPCNILKKVHCLRYFRTTLKQFMHGASCFLRNSRVIPREYFTLASPFHSQPIFPCLNIRKI